MAWIAGSAVIAAGTLVGCGGDDSSSSTTTSSSTSSAKTSSTSSKSSTSTSSSNSSSSSSSNSSSSTSSTSSSSASSSGSSSSSSSSSSSTSGSGDAGTDATVDDGGSDATVDDGGSDATVDDGSSDATADAPTACDTRWPDAGTNIVTNPDFESGTTTGWSADFGGTLGVSSTIAHCGTHSGELSGRTENYDGIFYTLPTTATSFTYAMWVYQDGPAAFQMTIAQVVCKVPTDDGGTTDSFTGGQFMTVPSNAWTFVSGTISVPANCVNTPEIQISQNTSVTGADGGAVFPDLFVDDVFISAQ